MKKFNNIVRVVIFLLVLFLAIGAGYVYALSPKSTKVSKITFESEKVDTQINGFKIAYLSDFNLTDEEDLDYFNDVINKLNSHPYDLVIFGGDLFEGKVFKTKEIAQTLNTIDCTYGKFALLGEKDKKHSKEIKSLYLEGGIEPISNTSRTIYYKNSSFELVACNDDKNVKDIDHNDSGLVVCVSHLPDTFVKNATNCDLQLSGHSLGGSFYIPFYGSILKPEGAKTYTHGSYTKGNSKLIVSNGIKGTSELPYKMFAKNEIEIITLSKKASN